MTSKQQLDHHPLDHAVWLSLTTNHSQWAEGDDRVKRYPVDMAPFHAMVDFSAESFDSLARISSPDDRIALVTLSPVPVPAQFEVTMNRRMNQMLGPTASAPVDDAGLELLEQHDQPAMLKLVEEARPGPFLARTNLFGGYYGVKHGNRLVAMTGERMHPVGFTELSAVCVHPDARGQGYAGRLLQHSANIILARGERPFLHVFDDNLSAIALYEKYGFVLRRTFFLTALKKRL